MGGTAISLNDGRNCSMSESADSRVMEETDKGPLQRGDLDTYDWLKLEARSRQTSSSTNSSPNAEMAVPPDCKMNCRCAGENRQARSLWVVTSRQSNRAVVFTLRFSSLIYATGYATAEWRPLV